jgi:serine/alanine adding enzyme
MEICELKREDEKVWDDYVFNHPCSTFYHQIGWKNVVERAYGHKSYYLLAEGDGKISGVLPLFFMKSLLFGNKLVSLPFAPYGGAIGDSKAIEELLIEHAMDITNEVNADYMELRNNIPRASKLITNTSYRTLVLKLEKDLELIWKGFNNKVRNAVRKSSKSELEIINGNVEEFYELYSKNMRDLGTPTHSKEFFNGMISEFQGKVDITIVQRNSKPVSGAILLYFKDTVISGWAASDRRYRDLSPNNLLYWSAIRSACEKGYKFFDFGRSIEGSGTYRFKKPWGAGEKHLQYLYYLNRIKHIPDSSQANLKRQRFARVWQILPLTLTNRIGAKLRRNLP